MARERRRLEARGERRHDREHADLGGDVRRRRQPQPDERREALRRRCDADVDETRRMPALAPHEVARQIGEHVEARDRRRPTGAGRAERRRAEQPEDEHAARGGVHDVGAHDRDHDRLDAADRLQIATDRREEEQRRQAPARRRRDTVRPPRRRRAARPSPAGAASTSTDPERERDREPDRQPDAVDQRVVRVAERVAPERVGDHVVEAEQHPDTEDRERVEHGAPDAHRADRFRTEPPDDDRVDETHRHPAELGRDDGPREPYQRPQLGESVVARRHGAGDRRVPTRMSPGTAARDRHA